MSLSLREGSAAGPFPPIAVRHQGKLLRVRANGVNRVWSETGTLGKYNPASFFTGRTADASESGGCATESRDTYS
jgi:hypothetical protein